MQLLECCPARLEYVPPLFFPGGFLQTVLPSLLSIFRAQHVMECSREILKVPERRKPDGAICCPEVIPSGEISLDWHTKSRITSTTATFLIVPGLTGESSSYYVQNVVSQIMKEWPGARVAAYNPRGRGGNALENPFLYSAGFTEDLRYVIDHISSFNQVAYTPIYVIAFSLGANAVCKMLGEDGDSSKIDGACLCSPPIDLVSMSNHLQNNVTGILFDKILVAGCNRLFTSEPVLKKAIDTDNGKLPVSMIDLDNRFIAPMFNFSCASEYYRASSSGNYLPYIRRPTLFVHARNDPIVPGELVRRDDFTSVSNNYMVSVMSEEGGHSMDLNRGIDLEPWFPELATQFLMQAHGRRKTKKERDHDENSWPSYCCVILQDDSGGYFLERRPASAKVAPNQLTCFGGKRDIATNERPEVCLERELREELGDNWRPLSKPSRAVDLYVDGELIAWFYLAKAPARDAQLSFETERGYSGVWWENDGSIESRNVKEMLSPWHACVFDAFHEGKQRADFVSG